MKLTEVNPVFVCDTIRDCSSSYGELDHTAKVELLKYCLSGEQYSNDLLVNLQLLPLANSEYSSFQSSNSPAVYLCTAECPKELLPNLEHKLVDLVSDTYLQTQLMQVAQSKITQLRVLDASAVSELLDEAIPSSWKNAEIVTLPEKDFNLDWIKLFWEWLAENELTHFNNKPIFPVHCGTLPETTQFSVVWLCQSQPVLYIPSYSECSETLRSVLQKFGIGYCTQSSFPYVQHQQLSVFVKTFTPSALIEVMAMKANCGSVNLSTEEAHFLCTEFVQVEEVHNILKDLQIFLSCENTSGKLYSINHTIQQSHFKGVVVQQSKSLINFSLLPDDMIVFSAEDYHQCKLLNNLDYFELNDAEFLKVHIFPNLHKMDDCYVDGIMTDVLDIYQSLCLTSCNFAASLQELQFVKVASGDRQSPSKLFDPLNACLLNIFKGQSVFPSTPYDDPKYISILKLCGLRTSVSPQEILDIIYSISLPPSSLPQLADEISVHRATAIVQYLESNFSSESAGAYKLNSEADLPFSDALMLLSIHRSWLPVIFNRPSNYPPSLTWKGEGYTSHTVSLEGSVCLSSSKSPLLPFLYGSQSFFVQPCGSLKAERPFQCLVPHFKEVISCKEQISRDLMIQIVNETYLAFMEILQEGTNVDVLSELKAMKEWVYIKKHHKFVCLDQVALKLNSSLGFALEPYLYVIPDSISAYSDLFIYLGINDSFTRQQILSILGMIKEDVHVDPALVDSEAALDTVMMILNWLTKNGTEDVGSDHVFVPVESSSELPDLREQNEPVYVDNEFLRTFISSSESDILHTFVHNRINQSLAKCLRITPLSRELELSEDTFEDASQQETLIERLKTILRDYKDGITIVKELLQNADDAEATEVNICFDARTHTKDRSKLLFPDMSKSHGPAIIFQNNGTFSDEDFLNIQKLAGATKVKKQLKIGKFGVGFCSVYHITDVPSFLSRDRLYIFDPTLKHLANAVKNPSQPGKKVSYLKKVIATSKQLEPYDGLFDFNPSSEYNGTMFRFPFRESESELSSTCYTESMVNSLFENIKQCGDKLLLFLQHVKRITVQKIENGRSTPDILYTIYKYSVPLLENASIFSVSSQDMAMNEISANIWLIATYEESGQKPAMANVACLLSSSNDGTYTVCDSLDGEIFCYLPLSLVSGLPIHISCNFAVTSSRLSIWTSESNDNSVYNSASEVEWNIFLIREVIPIAYLRLLLSLATMFQKNLLENYIFHSLWPLSSKLQKKNPWENLVVSFYNSLLYEKLFYSESMSKWLTFQESKFLDANILGHSVTLPCVLKVLHHLSLPLVNLPSMYMDHLELSGELLTDIDFIQLFFDKLSELKDILIERNEVMYHLLRMYALQRNSMSQVFKLIKEKLDIYDCIPTSPDGTVLRKCKEIVNPHATFSKLFDEDDHRLPAMRLADDDLVITSLKHAGMMHTLLPWELIIDRAQSVSTLIATDRLKAFERVSLILNTMSSCVSGEPPTSGLTIDSVPFLPVMQSPENYPLDWHGYNYQPIMLTSGNVLMLSVPSHASEYRNLNIAGSQVAFLCENLPNEGGCDSIYKQSSSTRKFLKLRSDPTLDEVISHLKTIIDKFYSSDPPSCDWISGICQSIYNFIDTLDWKGEKLDLHELKALPCIWNGKAFLEVESVATNWELEYGPYLYSTPPQVAANKKFSATLGIKESFGHEDAIRVLKTMKEGFGDEPVDNSCKEVIAKLMYIFDQLDLDELKKIKNDVFLLDTHDVLHLASDLRYNDAPWLPIETECTLVSSKLSRELATNLGVRLVRSALLDQFLNKEQYYVDTAMGQCDELTQGIQTIIQDYPADISILKELLQNADNAKAKKLCIILDKRTHESESVLSEEWKKLQGPALLVWNDSTFTEEDLQRIMESSLGYSKQSESETIGLFGIGFKVAYHLSDCPSFVIDGDTLCVLDPHLQYLPEQGVPSARYDQLKRKCFWEKFADMASAYLQSGVDDMPEEILGGSLFRFPIRHTHDMVNSSKIIDSVRVTPLTANDLFEKIKLWMPDLKKAMLFLNHVIDIKFLVIHENNTTQSICHYRTKIEKSAKSKISSLENATSDFSEESGFVSHVISYPLTISEKGRVEKWLIQRGVGDLEELYQTWQYVKIAKPWHGIAAPLQASKDSESKDTMKLFCTLPLASESGVPVHINGNFLLSADRSKLDSDACWNKDLLSAIASSYSNFLSQARTYYLKSGYTNRKAALSDMNKYYSLFPRLLVTDVADKWSTLACRVYRHLIQSNAEVLCIFVYTGHKIEVKWHPLSSQQESDQVHFWCDTPSKVQKVIHPILQDLGLKMTSAPCQVMDCFNFVNCELAKLHVQSSELQFVDQGIVMNGDGDSERWRKIPTVSPSSVFEYYTKHFPFSSAGQKLPCLITETLFHDPIRFSTFIRFLVGMELSLPAITSHEISTYYSFPNNPFSHFLLLTASEELMAFDKNNKVFNSRFYYLFPNHLGKFLHPVFQTYLSPSYFISNESSVDEEKKCILALILEIFDDTLPDEIKDVKVISNASAIVEAKSLMDLWECFDEDQVFASFIPDILQHWALLLTTDNRLYSNRSKVLPSYPSENDQFSLISDVMAYLHMPFLNTTVVTAKLSSCPELTDRSQVLSNFYHLNEETPLVTLLNEAQINAVIEYLSGDSQLACEQDSVEQIRSLPLYKDIDGDYVSITNTTAYVWPQNACDLGYSQWSYGLNAVFLQPEAKWRCLGTLKQLSIQEISTEQLYIQYIFQNFGKMLEVSRYEHLRFIRDNLYQANLGYHGIKVNQNMSDIQSNQIVTAGLFIDELKSLRCIGQGEQCLMPIHCFCDHTCKIFQVFSTEFQNLPQQLRDKEWLEFFRGLGLQVKLKEEEFVKLCESTASGKFESPEKCSQTLLEYLFSDEICELWHMNIPLLNKIAEIPFVAVADISSVDWIAEGCYPDRPLVKLNGAASETLCNVLWTVKPIIQLPAVCSSTQLSIEVKCLICHLNITTGTAQVSDVVANLQNICHNNPRADEGLFVEYHEYLLRTKYEIANLFKVVSDNFKFLHCVDGENLLDELSCIPVRCENSDNKVVFVKPNSVILSTCDDTLVQFYPFLHPIPPDLQTSVGTLEKLGVKQTFELHHMQIVLEKIFKKSPGSLLSRDYVKKAMECLSRLLGVVNLSEIEEHVAELSPLYLPDVDNAMRLSTEMLYNDTSFDHMELDLTGTQYYYFDSEQRYSIDARTFCQLLPEQIRPKKLTDLCDQLPDPQCDQVAASELAEVIEKSLNNSNPADLANLFKKFIPHDISQNEETMKSVATILSSISVVTVKNLSTQFILKESKKVIGRLKSDFYPQLNSSKPILYVDCSLEDENEIICELSQHLYELMSEHVPVSLMNAVPLRKKFYLMNKIMDYLRAPEHTDKEKMLSKHQISAKEPVKFELGGKIPDHYYHYLDQYPFNVLQPMELVAYEDQEGCLVFAQIVHLIEADGQADHMIHKKYHIYTSRKDLQGKIVSILDLYKFLDNASTVPPTNTINDDDITAIKERLRHEILEILEILRFTSKDFQIKGLRRLLKSYCCRGISSESSIQILQSIIDDFDKKGTLFETDSQAMNTEMADDGNFRMWDKIAQFLYDALILELNSRPTNGSVILLYKYLRKCKKNPDIGVLYVKQASIDFHVLCDIHLTANTSKRYGHVCSMAHHVAEKAMKGSLYALCGTDRRKVADHSLTRLAYALKMICPDETKLLAEHAIPLDNYYHHTCYPTYWPDFTSAVACKEFSPQDAGQAKEHAECVLAIVTKLVSPFMTSQT